MERASSIAKHVTPQYRVITIVGGGNSGHICASLVHGNTRGQVRVQLLTSKPEVWTTTPVVRFPDGSCQEGKVDKVSSDPNEVLPNSDLVLWTGPVNATKEIFEAIKPFVNIDRTVVGTIFAQGLVHVLAQRVFGPDVKFFALRNIPWLCRTISVGRECEVVGPKSSIECALINLPPQWIPVNLQPLFLVRSYDRSGPTIEALEDFCPIVFNPANQIIHPATYWGLFRKWLPGKPLRGESKPRVWLYRGMDELSGQILEALDEELQDIKTAYFKATGRESCLGVLRLRDRLLLQYGDQIEDKSTLAKMVGTNKAYSIARTPVIETAEGVSPNPQHRVVVDDIGWGLCVLVSIGDRLGVATTVMKMMIEWHQQMMGKEFLINGQLCGQDCGELVLLNKGDPLELVAKVASHQYFRKSVEATGDLTSTF